MKQQLTITLKRLKNPTVFLSIVSQGVGILALLKVSVDVDVITGIAVSICSILVALGIMSNPNTKNRGFGDDIVYCENCKKDTEHFEINGRLTCRICGTAPSKEMAVPTEMKP